MPHLAWRYLHLALGWGGLIAFLATGQYMDRWLDHLVGQPDQVRLLFRSTHIYLLWSALANLLVGSYWQPRLGRAAAGLQVLGSLALLAGPGLLLGGFMEEPYLTNLARPWSRPAIFLALGGSVLHAVACWWPAQAEPSIARSS